MVEVLVENSLLTAEVVFDGDAERLDKVDDGLFLKDDPCLSLLIAECISGNLWHDICEIRVRRQILQFMGAGTWHVEPHDASKSPAAEDDRRPESTALVVPLETGGGTVRDDETEHGTQSKWMCSMKRIAG